MEETDLIKWSSTFSVGVKVIDDQHKGLLNLVNDLFNHVVGDDDAERAYFKDVIQQAVDYVKVHFTTEEKIMTGTNFPGYADHKKAHDVFVLTVIEKVRDYEMGRRLTLVEFTKFLKEWILTHIAIMDKQYFGYFKQISTRNADGKLSINSTNISN